MVLQSIAIRRSSATRRSSLPWGARAFIWSQSLSAVGDNFIPFALSQYHGSDGLGRLALSYGLLLAAKSAATACALPVAGVLGDRRSLVQVALFGDLMRAAGVTIAAIGLVGDQSLLIGLIGVTLLGMGDGSFRAVGNAMIPALVPADQRKVANGLLGSGLSVAALVGPALGALIVVAAGPSLALILDAATFVVSFAVLVRLFPVFRRYELTVAADNIDTGSFLRAGVSGVAAARRLGWLFPMEAISIIHITFVVAPFFVLLPPILVTADRTVMLAVILGGMAAGRAVGGVVAGRTRTTRYAVLILVGQACFAFGPLSLGLFGEPYVAVALALALAGVGIQISDTLFYTALQETTPPNYLARVISIVQLISLALMPIGQLIAAPLQARLGTSTLMIGSGLLMLGTGGLPLLSRAVRNLGADERR